MPLSSNYRAPKLSVVLDKSRLDLSGYIDSFTYEEDMDSDNALKITIKRKLKTEMLELIDDPDIIAGNFLKFNFGYIGWKQSENFVSRISEVRPKFQKLISLDLVGLDKGAELKKGEPNDVYENKTASQIATEIANKYKLKTDIDPTTKSYESYPQSNKNDFEFLRELAEKEKEHYVVYVKGDTLHFRKIGLSRRAKYLYTYGEPDVISFLPVQSEAKDDGESTKVEARGFDPMTKKSLSAESKNTDTNLGKNQVQFDVNGNIIGVKRVIQTPSADKEELENVANAENKKAALNVITATLKLEGNPEIELGELVTMKGVGQKYGGNWLITKITHKIAGGNVYHTTLGLKKNGTNKATSKAAETVKANNSKGNKNPEKTKSLVNFDVDGNKK